MNTTRKLHTGLLFTAIVATLLFAVVPQVVHAQDAETPVEHGDGFVDADGDGYNDNAPDADGDGIPNGQDSDYARPGKAAGNGHGRQFVDEDGDGFNDNAPDADGDGIPNGQDDDYAPQGQAARHKGANGRNGTGAENSLRMLGKGNGYRGGNGEVAETHGKGSGFGRNSGSSAADGQNLHTGGRMHGAK